MILAIPFLSLESARLALITAQTIVYTRLFRGKLTATKDLRHLNVKPSEGICNEPGIEVSFLDLLDNTVDGRPENLQL